MPSRRLDRGRNVVSNISTATEGGRGTIVVAAVLWLRRAPGSTEEESEAALDIVFKDSENTGTRETRIVDKLRI